MDRLWLMVLGALLGELLQPERAPCLGRGRVAQAGQAPGLMAG